MQRLRVFVLQGFLETKRDQRQRDAAKHRQRHQRDTPAEQFRQQAAQWREGACQRTQAAQALGHDAGAVLRLVEVTHNRPRAHHGCAHRGALHDAPADQLRHRGRQCAGNRGQRVGRQAAEQNGAPAKAVGQRAPDQLGDAKGQQQGAQGELRLRHGRGEAFGQRRQGGQVQVGGDGLYAQQHGQDQYNQPGGHGGLYAGAHGGGRGNFRGGHRHPPEVSRLPRRPMGGPAMKKGAAKPLCCLSPQAA